MINIFRIVITIRDEELLSQGIELNDALQVLLEKHDAIASGSKLPSHLVGRATFSPNAKPCTLSRDKMKGLVFAEGEEEEDESEQLARRCACLNGRTKSQSCLYFVNFIIVCIRSISY